MKFLHARVSINTNFLLHRFLFHKSSNFPPFLSNYPAHLSSNHPSNFCIFGQFVRVVKEIDSNLSGYQLGSARTGSNPVADAILFAFRHGHLPKVVTQYPHNHIRSHHAALHPHFRHLSPPDPVTFLVPSRRRRNDSLVDDHPHHLRNTT